MRAAPGEVIRTPGGGALAPVVAPEESAPRAPAVRPATPPPADTGDEDDDDGDFEDEDDGAGNASTSSLNVRLTGLQMGTVNKPMPVAVWAAGDSRLSGATIAIKFDERLLRVNKVESTGMFDGKLGAKLPFEVRDGVLVVSLARPPDMASTPINGQLMNITFDVIGAGSVTLQVVPGASQLVGLDNVVAQLRVDNPLVVTVR